jgi:hypothetical protein
MNSRESKIIALEIGHRTLGLVDVGDALAETGVAYSEADIAKVQRELDLVAQRLHERYEALLKSGRKFQSPFEGSLPGKTGEACPDCKEGQVVVRTGKHGRFRGCSRFPDCEWRAPLVVGTCPLCGEDLVERTGRRGPFVGCTGYPECEYTRDAIHEDNTV